MKIDYFQVDRNLGAIICSIRTSYLPIKILKDAEAIEDIISRCIEI